MAELLRARRDELLSARETVALSLGRVESSRCDLESCFAAARSLFAEKREEAKREEGRRTRRRRRREKKLRKREEEVYEYGWREEDD